MLKIAKKWPNFATYGDRKFWVPPHQKFREKNPDVVIFAIPLLNRLCTTCIIQGGQKYMFLTQCLYLLNFFSYALINYLHCISQGSHVCLSYFSLPFVHKGVHLDPIIFKYFPVGILVRNLHHICIHLKKIINQQKNH